MALEQIVARTRTELARRQRELPMQTLLARVAPSDRSLARVLRRGRTGFILECKRASPSEGMLRPEYHPADIARAYAEHGDAISVLTDEPFFRGSLDHLAAVRNAVPLPVLRKDFVLEPYQVVEARASGADAVLLMLSLLDDSAWRECAATAGEIGLETLTEVHTEAELARAIDLGAPIVGINNRDLKTLRVDLDTVRRLAPRLPRDRVVVCESGIRNHADVRNLAPLVDALLVGTSLMRRPDLGEATRELIYGITKVCGLTRPADARSAWQSGATHGGLIFADESPRRVTLEQAAGVAAAAPLKWVGVFVNQSAGFIGQAAGSLPLNAVQLHGEETIEQVEEVRRAIPAACEVWKAVRIRDRIPDLAETGAERLVLDTWRAGRRGGTGERFDWSLLERYPRPDRILLGGGLTPETAAAADGWGTWGLDVNSGVEERPGVKSLEKLAAFFRARRGTGERGAAS